MEGGTVLMLYKKSFKKIKKIIDALKQTTGPLENWRALYLNNSAEAHMAFI